MKNLNNIYLLVLLILTGMGMYLIFKPFLIAIFVAFTLSRLFNGWYQKILNLLKNPSLSSFATSTLLFLIIFLPVLLVGKLVASELLNGYQAVNSDQFKTDLFSLKDSMLAIVNNSPYLNEKLNNSSLLNEQNLSNLTKTIGNTLANFGKYAYQSMSHFVFTLFITFFCLYYFFKDGDRLVNKFFKVSPLKDYQEKRLLENFVEISRATLRGSLIIAIIQGFLTTILFMTTGVSSAVLLGVVATIFALIPMVGTAIVWLPVGVIMLLLGNIWQGITILMVGSLVIGSIDNILRPQLVGNKTSLHPLLVFLSTMGGITLFGITGFLLGPVTVVLFLNLLDIYKEEFKSDLEKYNG
jgi:predicted PurR-regulated permease PerM